MAAARQNAAAAFRLGGMQKAARGACGEGESWRGYTHAILTSLILSKMFCGNLKRLAI